MAKGNQDVTEVSRVTSLREGGTYGNGVSRAQYEKGPRIEQGGNRVFSVDEVKNKTCRSLTNDPASEGGKSSGTGEPISGEPDGCGRIWEPVKRGKYSDDLSSKEWCCSHGTQSKRGRTSFFHDNGLARGGRGMLFKSTSITS